MIGLNTLEKLNEIDKKGRKVKCPHCSLFHQVHYFSYSGVTCYTCRSNMENYMLLHEK